MSFLQTKFSVSNTLILLSIFFTLLAFIFNNMYIFWMNDRFFQAGIYYIWPIQMFVSQFLHGNIMHLLFNSIFVYYFGNILESIIGSQKMLLFFILNTLFLGIVITFFGRATTVWISGFALAILSYYTLLLWQRNNPEYTGGVTAIVLNLLIGLSPWISFLGHFWWMVFWGLFWYISQKKK